jgi:hypothetical protein
LPALRRYRERLQRTSRTLVGGLSSLAGMARMHVLIYISAHTAPPEETFDRFESAFDARMASDYRVVQVAKDACLDRCTVWHYDLGEAGPVTS